MLCLRWESTLDSNLKTHLTEMFESPRHVLEDRIPIGSSIAMVTITSVAASKKGSREFHSDGPSRFAVAFLNYFLKFRSVLLLL